MTQVAPPPATPPPSRPAARSPRVLINGLSIGSGGTLTVGRGLLRHLAEARPGWGFTLAVTEGRTLHEELRGNDRPPNAGLLWCPPESQPLRTRGRYERDRRRGLLSHVAAGGYDAVLQLNGMVIPGTPVPVLAHFQDPYPYQPEAWDAWNSRLNSFLKRRAHRRTFGEADAFGWTSDFLRRLICSHHERWPERSEVYYNGLPDAWVGRASDPSRLTPLADRPAEVLTVSNVSHYKRQDLVIEAVARLAGRPGTERLTYRIVGWLAVAGERERLAALAARLGVADRVVIEGRVDDARLAEVFGRARCFALMSVCESFGLGVPEAQSFGVPVVAADRTALPEVVGDGGVIVPADDAGRLAEAIHRVLTDDAHADRLRRAGAENVKRFRWTESAGRMADRLGELVGVRPGRGAA